MNTPLTELQNAQEVGPSSNIPGSMVVVATVVLFLSIVTLSTFETWQTVVLAMLCMILSVYILLLSVDKFSIQTSASLSNRRQLYRTMLVWLKIGGIPRR
jgi:uncharacterized membrane protein YesL